MLKELLIKYLDLQENESPSPAITNNEGIVTLEPSITEIEPSEDVIPAYVDDVGVASVSTSIILPVSIKEQINSALALDLSSFPRYHRINTDDRIEISVTKQATAEEELLLLINAWRGGAQFSFYYIYG